MTAKLWGLIGAAGACLEFTLLDPNGRYAPDFRWLEVPEVLARWADHTYIEQDGAIVPPSLDYLKTQLKDAVTTQRWQVENGGLTLENGIRLLTDKEGRDSISTLLDKMERYALTEVDFKAASGWLRASMDDMKTMDEAVVRHVQAARSAERAHHDALDGLEDIAAVAGYDLLAGWPCAPNGTCNHAEH
jgi:hypothetical protein